MSVGRGFSLPVADVGSFRFWAIRSKKSLNADVAGDHQRVCSGAVQAPDDHSADNDKRVLPTTFVHDLFHCMSLSTSPRTGVA